MGARLWTAGSAVAVLFALSASASDPGAAITSPGVDRAACHHPFLADVDTSVPGEVTPVAAAVVWSLTEPALAPSGAPHDGWAPVDDGTILRSGDWFVGVSRTASGGWVVSGLGCGLTQD